MAAYRLSYFDGKGKAELARILFVMSGTKFEDNRITGKEWTELKPSTLTGKMPFLEIDETAVLCESLAIARYISRVTGLYGATDWEAAVCDMISDISNDVTNAAILKAVESKTEEAKEEAQKKLDVAMATLEKVTAKHKKGKFVLGEKPSFADALLLNAEQFATYVNPDEKLEKYPSIAYVCKNLSALPAVAKHISERRVTTF